MSFPVRQKVKGRGHPWYVFFNWNRTTRSWKVGSKKAAEAVARKLRAKWLAGELKLDDAKANTPRFGQYAQHYLESYAAINTKKTTWRGYQSLLAKHILPAWGQRRLSDIKRADVKKLIRQKQNQGLRNGTIFNIKNVISAIFSLAVEEEIIPTNPTAKVCKYLQRPEQKKHINVLTREQVSDLLALVQRKYSADYPILMCAARTGMRSGELAGLAWDCVNFEANLIHVRRSYSHGLFSSPKNRKSRYIDMSRQLAAVLLAHRSAMLSKHDGKLPSHLALGETLRLVFARTDGNPADLNTFRRGKFYKFLKQANCPHIRFHDIRHTFASLLLQQGESLHYVKEQMGHASIQTTVDIYGHIVPGSNRRAVNRLDDEGPGLRIVSDAS